jgi:ABC-type glycerol-3-phosphate transport system substrate-binding protein
VIFYDRDLWDAAVVAYPTIDWTREDFLRAAQQLTILSEGTTTQWGYVDTLSIERLPFLESSTAKELGGPTLPNLDAPQMVDALRWYTDLALVHKVMPQSPITPTAAYAKLVADIRGSNAAMWVAPLGDLPFYRESQGRQIGLATLPLSGNSRGLLHTPAHRAYFISNATPHPQESWRWLKFLSRQPLGSSSPGMFVNAIPVRHSVAESTGFWRRWNNDDREVIERALKEADTGVHAEQLAALQEAILAVWQGRPATEAAAAAQAAAMTAYASRPETSAASGAPYQPEDNAPEKRTHLLFAPESLGDDFFYRDLAASFNANQDAIQVDVVTSEKLGRADCFIGPSDRIRDTGSRDVLNLAPLLDAQSSLDLADFAFVESFGKQGDLYGLPAYAPAAIVRYDPAAFDRHDLAYPAPGWSLDEFLTTARILSQGEGPSHRYGFVSVLGEATTLPIFIAAQGANLWDTAGRPRFAAPDVVEAVRWYVELGHNHGIMPVLPGEPGASSDEDADQRRALVADGRAAMWMTLVGLGNPTTQMTAGGKEAGMAPVPGAQRTLFLPHGFFIAADSPHAAACWDWCVYAATHPAHPDLGVPAYKPALLSEAFVAQVTPDVVATYRALLDYDGLSQPPGAGPQYQALLDALDDIYEGADVQAALEEAQRAASQP